LGKLKRESLEKTESEDVRGAGRANTLKRREKVARWECSITGKEKKTEQNHGGGDKSRQR